MARRPEICDSDIIAAGRALLAAGQAVNGFRLHRGVGGRGRPDRLMLVWDAFKAANEVLPDAPKELQPLPSAAREELAALNTMIGERLEQTVRAIADGLSAEARTRAQAERDGLTREREGLEAAERDAVEAISALDERLEVLREDNARLAECLRQAQASQEAAEVLRTADAERLAVVEAGRLEAIADAARVGERAMLMERRVGDLEAELAGFRAAQAEYAIELGILRARRGKTEKAAVTDAGTKAAHAGAAAVARNRRAPAQGGGRRATLPVREVAAKPGSGEAPGELDCAKPAAERNDRAKAA